jgi:hypothetical protein
MIEATLLINEPLTIGLVGHRVSSTIQPEGYRVEVWCTGWGTNTDGSVRLDLVATIKSPEGMPTGGEP